MGSLYGFPTMWPLFVSFDSPVGSVRQIFSQDFLSVQRRSDITVHIFSTTVFPFSCTGVHLLLKILIFFPIRHCLMLHWFADLMNVTEEGTIHRRRFALHQNPG